MTLKTNMWIIDNHTKSIYYFHRRTENSFFGYEFSTNPKIFVTGSWPADEWIKFAKSFISVGNPRITRIKSLANDISKRRKHSMIESMLEWNR